jgi:regulatory protein
MSGWKNRRGGSSSSGSRDDPPATAKQEPTAYQRALGLLVRREHSRKELARKLSDKGIEREDAELALDKLNRQDFQNDTRFAAALARSRASAGYGPGRIRAELATHGLGRDDIAAALEACERDWDASARDIVQRRYGGKDLGDHALRRKALDFLLRRGFEHKSALAAVRATPGETSFDD